MCLKLSFIAVPAALMILVLANHPAQAQFPVLGGPGGGGFTRSCSPPDYVVGIYVRAGAWIDAIGLKCGTFNTAGGTRFSVPPFNTPFHGGNGGALQEKVCPTNSSVRRIKFGFTLTTNNSPKYIDFVELTCRRHVGAAELTSVDCMETGNGCWEFHPAHPPQPSFRSFRQDCPDGTKMAGINGRSGVFLDALGLICRP